MDRRRCSFAAWVVFASCLLLVPFHRSSAQTPPGNTDAANAQAHALLDRVLRANGLSVDGGQPWHIRADFQWQMPNRPVESGTLEAWWKAPDTWRRTYRMKKLTWTEWSVDRIHQFGTPSTDFPRQFADLRIATPLITPLFQAKNFLPEYPMQTAPPEAGSKLDCLSIVDPVRYVAGTDPDFLFPKYCVDGMGVLRGVVTSNTLVTFADYTIFDKRAVAKTVDVFVDGHKMAEAKITLLEPLSAADAAMLQPDKDAEPEPFIPNAFDPKPVLVHSDNPFIPASTVIAGDNGAIAVPVIIGKDGRVRPSVKGMPAGLGAFGAAIDAASRFRYQPYLIDGQPVEVAWTIVFTYGHNGYEYQAAGDAPKPTGYDPKRDPAADLQAAETQARQEHKHILLEVGGDWCIWCGYLDQFFATHPDVDAALRANYVLVKVNWSEQNHNNAFLTQYAVVRSFPFLIVLDENGKLLTAEKTDELEKGQSYDAGKMKSFLSQWGPAAGQVAAR